MDPASGCQGAISAPRACRILVMAALPLEVRPFLRRVKGKARRDLGLPAWEWEAGSAVVAVSGMGEAAARRAGETLLGRCRPELLVSIGFGGALTPGLAAGDLVLGETFWHYNPDTREPKAGPRPAPPRPLPRLCGALKQAGLTAVTGSVVTTSRIIHKGREGEPLAGLPRPVLDLETGVLAELAAARGLAFLSLRAITDTRWRGDPGISPCRRGPGGGGGGGGGSHGGWGPTAGGFPTSWPSGAGAGAPPGNWPRPCWSCGLYCRLPGRSLRASQLRKGK